MKRLVTVALSLFSSLSLAQSHVDMEDVFSTQDQFTFTYQSDESENQNGLSLVDNIVSSLVDFTSDESSQSFTQWELSEPSTAIENYAWRHLNVTEFAESSYVSEFKVGLTQPLTSDNRTFYNLGMALIRPAETSLAVNALSMSGDDRSDQRSAFFSVSVHSTF